MLVGTERRRLKMVRMSCLLGSPMIIQEPGRSWPRQPGRAELWRLPPPRGRRRPRGGAAREDQTPPIDDPAPGPAHRRSARAARSSPPLCVMRMRREARGPPGPYLALALGGACRRRTWVWFVTALTAARSWTASNDALLPRHQSVGRTCPSKWQRRKLARRGASLPFPDARRQGFL